MSAVKVLIVDDSPVVREQAMELLRRDPDIEVLGIADNKENAREKIAALKPDVITITLRSKKNISEFVKEITSQISIPVVVVTETDVNYPDADKTGAVTFVKKPLIHTASTMEKFSQRVIQQIKDSAKIKSKPAPVQATPAPAQATTNPPVKQQVPETHAQPAKPGFESKPKAVEPVKTAEPKPKAPEAAVKPPEPKAKAPEPAAKAPEPRHSFAPTPKPAQPPVAPKQEQHKPEADIKPKVIVEQHVSKPEPKPIDQNDPAARAMAAAAAAKTKLVGQPTPKGKHHVIALGASTGGTDALHTVLQDLPVNTPGIVIVQHMPEMFTKMYADRLNRGCKMTCVEARDGERVEEGKIILAAGNFHMRLARDSRGYYVTSQRGEKVSGHCPSVDVLFESVANVAGRDAIGAIFTGMGADGAIGLKKMRDAGAFTIGQDEKTCVVYGMPMVAYNMGGVCVQAPLDRIAQIILENC